MKKSFFIIAAFNITVSVNAQFVVNNQGNASVQVNNANYALTVKGTAKGLEARAMGSYSGWGYGVHGTANYNSPSAVGVYGETFGPGAGDYQRGYGIMGVASNASCGHNYGVFGRVFSTNVDPNEYYKCGAAIYGTIVDTDTFGIELPDEYAGYFNGPVCVAQDLLVLYSVSSPHFYGRLHSPRNLLDTSDVSAEEVTENVLDRLSAVKTLSYYSADETKGAEVSRKQYTLSEASIEETFPELVCEDRNGTKCVDYLGLVNLLVHAVNELQTEVRHLKMTNKQFTPNLTGISEKLTEKAYISQNVPNPWSVTTTINAFVPQTVSKAVLGIYDLTGKEVKEINITDRGKVSINLKSYDFVPGIYIYTLLNDGNVVETKRMLLTK